MTNGFADQRAVLKKGRPPCSLLGRVAPERPVPALPQETEPLRWLLRWDPFREVTPSWMAAPVVEPTFSPAFEVMENKGCFLFKADLPGMKEEGIEVKLTGSAGD